MDNETKKTILSQKYLEVMAATNGHRTISNPTDHATIQIQELIERKLPKGRRATMLSNREIKGVILPYPENQVKQGNGSVKFSIDTGVYHEILEAAGRQRPLVLFICTWPSDDKGAVIFSKEAMSMICTSYWFLPNKKSKPSDASKTINIEVPDDQIVDAKAFEKIFDQIYI